LPFRRANHQNEAQNFKSIEALDFDIPNRELLVFHHENEEEIFKQLETLNFDTQHISTEFTQEKLQEHKNQTQLLWSVLESIFSFFARNFLWFLV
jgi:hypothetical protein